MLIFVIILVFASFIIVLDLLRTKKQDLNDAGDKEDDNLKKDSTFKENDDFEELSITLGKKLPAFIGILVLVVLLASSVFTVKQGTVAVITRFGKVAGVKEAGLNFKMPLIDKKHTMVTREQTIKFGVDEEFKPLTVSTKDMQTISLDLTVSNVTSDPLKVYTSFTGRQLESLMLPRIKDSVQTNISRYTIEEFVSQRAKLADDIYKDVKKDFEPYGIVITNVSITNHDFSDVYEEAVEKKKVAEQAVDTERALQKQKVVEQEARVNLAKLKLEERRLEAEANKVETSSITDELLQKWWIEKWDGKMPKVTGEKQSLMLPSNVIKDK